MLDAADTVPAGPAADLLSSALGRDGLAGTPGITHAEITTVACDLVRRLLEVDECWVQAPGAVADTVTGAVPRPGRAWLANPSIPATTRTFTGARTQGAVGAAPFSLGGQQHALVVFARVPRAWSAADEALLAHGAAVLAEALESTSAHQLSPAQLARQKYDDLRRELMTLLNHELRTPLASLGAGLELLTDLLEVDQSPAVTSLIARLEQNLSRLLALTDNVTTIGDIATPQARLDATSFPAPDAREVIRTCVAQLARSYDTRVDLVQPTEPAPVAMPASELREIVDRVLDNAAKFSPADGVVEVAVDVRRSRVVITVSDAGIGVPESQHHGMGRAFFRASNAQLLEKQGAGLGLAAAAAIARRWSGTLEFDSVEGSGTTVKILLPRASLPIL